jgi:membrane fusion protein, multidrug efflux system
MKIYPKPRSFMDPVIRLLVVSFVLQLLACSRPSSPGNEGSGGFIQPQNDTTVVPVVNIHLKPFAKQTWSNGVLLASRKTIVSFPIQGNIVELTVKNGQYVTAGQLLARIDDHRQKENLDMADLAYKKSILEFEDHLLRYGYAMQDTSTMPPEILYTINLNSGRFDALLQLKKARYELSLTSVLAPVDGVVTGLEAQLYSPSSEYKSLCTILNDRLMRVGFSLLESDVGLVHIGMPIRVLPVAFPGVEFKATITEAEPTIDKNGQMKVWAELQNPDRSLIDGMKVRVILETYIDNQLVVPKGAVLSRQGRQVVFTVDEGYAIWNYVITGFENASEFTIAEGLHEGQMVITGNNLTIGHRACVKTISAN